MYEEQHLYPKLAALFRYTHNFFRAVVVLVNKYCILMLVSSIFLITNFKNVFACVKFCYKVLSNLLTNIFFSEIADHFPRVFLGATVTSRLATKKTCHQ